MRLKVVGSGCPTCQRLYDMVQALIKEQKIDAEVEYSTDINELIEAGAMGSPGLFKDGKLVRVGMADEEELLKIIKE